MAAHIRQRRAAILLVIVALSLLAEMVGAAPPAAPAAPGQLDTAFAGWAGDGVANLSVSVEDIAVQPDGKVVIVGNGGVARYLPDGRPDLTFDSDGRAAVPGAFYPRSVAVLSDGRIVVGGGQLDGAFYLARLTPSGAPDTSFDGDGWLEDEDDKLRGLESLTVQADGKVIACGSARFSADDIDFGIARYNLDGLRDNSFGGDGIVTIPFGEEEEDGRDVALTAGGKNGDAARPHTHRHAVRPGGHLPALHTRSDVRSVSERRSLSQSGKSAGRGV